MKKHALALAASTALAAAVLAPAMASAQPWRNDRDYARTYDRGYGRGYAVPHHLTSGYVDGLYWKLDNAAAEGRLSWREANRLKAELRPVQEFAYPVETGRASPWQRQRLERVVSRIDAALAGGGRYGSRNAYGYR
jgi:hypothetical protein